MNCPDRTATAAATATATATAKKYIKQKL